jgi:hypothetical protein
MKKFDKIFKKSLETILLEAGLINDEIFQHVQRVQEDTGRLPGDILIDEKYCTETDIARELARQLQLPFLEIDRYSLTKGLIDSYPPELLHRLQIVPVDRFGGTVAFAMAQHMSMDGFKQLQAVETGEISFYVSMMGKVRDLLDKMVPFDKAKIWESLKKKKEESKPKPASWTDIFDTANKNVVQGMKRDTKITARLDIFDTANKKIIEGLKKPDEPPAAQGPFKPSPGSTRIAKAPGAPPAGGPASPAAPAAPPAPASPPKGTPRAPGKDPEETKPKPG